MIRILLLSLFAFTLPAGAADDAGCLKQVFNIYCLGGDPASLPEPIERRSEGDREILSFETAQRPVRVTIRDGRIAAISREEPPGAWLNFTDWRAKLVRLYRAAEDLSTLPRYATARNSRLNAIKAGKGKAHLRWPQGAWWVELIWDNTDYVLLNYEVAPPSKPVLEEDVGL